MELWLWDEEGSGTPASRGLADSLRATGFACTLRNVGSQGLARAGDGQPLLLWQSRDDPAARARAFAAGADEIVGPWMTPEEALARLVRFRQRPVPAPTCLRLGPLEIDLIDHAATRDGQRLGLLRREYDLLLHLARHAGRIQSRQALLGAIWRLAFDPGTNVVEVHVSRLRAKLDRGFAWPMLHTVRGAGYALVTDGTA